MILKKIELLNIYLIYYITIYAYYIPYTTFNIS